jgi:hypothetical protein
MGANLGIPGYIKTEAASASATAAGARYELSSELCELCLELAKVVAGGLVFLGCIGVSGRRDERGRNGDLLLA